jgi:hypothetical protein
LAGAALLLGGCTGTADAGTPASKSAKGASSGASTGGASTGGATAEGTDDSGTDDSGTDDSGTDDSGTDDSGTDDPDAWPSGYKPDDNGATKMAPAEIVKRSLAEIHQAKSYRAAGTLNGKHALVANGQPNEVYLDVVGKDFHASIELPKAKVEMLSVGGKLYVRSSESFFRSIGYEAPAKTWIAMDSPADSFGGVFRAFTIDGMYKFAGTLSKEDTAAEEAEAVLVSDPAGDQLVVSTTTDLLPIELDAPDESELQFSAYGEANSDVKGPPAAQVLDYNQMVGE